MPLYCWALIGVYLVGFSLLFVFPAPWWVLTLVGIHMAVFALVFWIHIVYLQMVTPGLALLRASVWEIYWATGWPHGQPLPMD